MYLSTNGTIGVSIDFKFLKQRGCLILPWFQVSVYRTTGGARLLDGRALDSGARGRGFETYLRRGVSLSKTLYSPKVLVIPRKQAVAPSRHK